MYQRNSGSAMSDDEKQEIYKALYGLNAEVNKLKAIIASGNFGNAKVPQPAEAAPRTLAPSYEQGDAYVSKPVNDWSVPENDVDIQEPAHHSEAHVEPESSSDNLSISQKSQDLIRKALEKYNGNRKKAAEELGISERTLYRKLPPEFRGNKKED